MITDDSNRLFSFAERLATLEAQHEQYLTDKDATDEDLRLLTKTTADTSVAVAALVNKITSWEGKFGAFVFLVGCVWTFLLTAWSSIMEFLKFKFGGT